MEKELNYDVVETKEVVKSHFVIDYNIAYSATHAVWMTKSALASYFHKIEHFQLLFTN